MKLRVLHLHGNPWEIGHQHGEQVADLRTEILTMLQIRLAGLKEQGMDFQPYIEQVDAAWKSHAPATIEILKGISTALSLPWEDYYLYSISSFLLSQARKNKGMDGCTTWAAGIQHTENGMPLLVKNRDYHPSHQPLQCLAMVTPARGYRYMCLTSAGSPGVFSSGMNEAGLAAVDTYVASKDLGAGVGRYSVMMDMLERCSTVQDALAYIPSVPHFGDGTVSVADAAGGLAVIEIAHSTQEIIQPLDDFIVSTNHFNSPILKERWLDSEPEHLKGNSVGRYNRVAQALRSSSGKVNAQWAQHLMRQNGNPQDAICRGPELDPTSMTISCAIFSPRQRGLWLANGLPSQTDFEWYTLD